LSDVLDYAGQADDSFLVSIQSAVFLGSVDEVAIELAV